MLLAACLHVTGCASTGGVAGAVGVAGKVRDVTALGLRLGCRVSDRMSRATGGPWVVPRTDEERAEDAAAGWFGEASGLVSGGQTPTVAPADEAPRASEPMPAVEPADTPAPDEAQPTPPPTATSSPRTETP
ncbi:MAG: hypothetical protein KDC14_05275 [Planctomycetes bacterium]|nr:hypothetical protein [Planctomycetota bacterium]